MSLHKNKYSYSELFKKFYYAQNASPIFINPFSEYEHGEIALPMNNELIKDPNEYNSPNYVVCIYLEKDGKRYGVGKALINIDIFERENGKVNGRFTNPTSISESEFRQWIIQINEEFEEVNHNPRATPNWY